MNLRRAAVPLVALVLATTAVPAAHAAPALEAGATQVDITPPPRTAATDAAEFVPACGLSATQMAQVWTGPRPFAFEKPYLDLTHAGRYVPGDPYCDSDHSGRYEAPYLAGGGGQNRWPVTADPTTPIQAEAIVFSLGSTRLALVVVDSIGLFNVTADAIRAGVARFAPDVQQVFVSSTHDESAPDPIGLWGPDLSDLPGSPPTPAAVSSGVDEAYLSFLASQSAAAVARADANLQPVALRVAMARQPSNTLSCWSSYPYIDDQVLPVMQAVSTRSGRAVFTLVNASTHVETLAFSSSTAYQRTLSGDWPARMRADLEADYPGSVAVELTGLVGSVETPTVYEPESTQVLNVPTPFHSVSGNPDGCSSIYPAPASGTPVTDALAFLDAYGRSVADTAAAALVRAGAAVSPRTLAGQQRSVCVQLENNLFVAAFAAGLFPDRPLFADPTCALRTAPHSPVPVYLSTGVGVVTIGPIQLAYSPGEVFPFTETRGAMDDAQMPFAGLPMTPWTSAQMAGSYRFMAGLGQDMIGYLFPPGNFVGSQGESDESPWMQYELAHGDTDRFGHGHADDSESVGPYAGLAVTRTLADLLASDPGQRPVVRPGLFVDSGGRLSDSPFAGSGFGGAVGILAVEPSGVHRVYRVGGSTVWATYDATVDSGTAGTALTYSVATAGVMIYGRPLLIDVFAGADDLGVPGA